MTKEYLKLAHSLADVAGAAILQHFRKVLRTEEKDDGSPVTQADKEAEAAMRMLIREKCPAHGIWGEEGGRERDTATLQWVLDPIDGTRAFMAGYPTFSTLIALCENGVPRLGVIDQPFLKERWAAVYEPIDAFSRKAPDMLSIATTSMPYFTPEQWKAFQRASFSHTLVQGGDAYAYAMLASGHLHAVIDAAMKPYDFCALVPVVEASGGVITDWSGKHLTLESKGDVVATCNPEAHQQLLDRLNG